MTNLLSGDYIPILTNTNADWKTARNSNNEIFRFTVLNKKIKGETLTFVTPASEPPPPVKKTTFWNPFLSTSGKDN